jgi:EAL domain-containing protein (putative c-di-GMP-specific phosphodiesterase class I)
LDNCPLDNAYEITKTLVSAVRDYRFLWKDRTFQIGVSIGIAPISADSEDTGQLLSQADVACYTAKDQGRNRVHVYQLDDSEPARRHTEILRAAELRDALEKDRFCVYCQPIVDLASKHRNTTHYELLLRLRDAEGKIVLPGSFIPPAERYGLIGSIDRWVIRTAFTQLGNGSDVLPAALITINLSGHSLSSAGFLEYVMRQFEKSNVPAGKICFEVTETAVIHNFNQAMRFITEMRARGCRFALDDFGSGVSSFSYLKRLPVDYLKIDGGFVQNILTDSADLAIVAAITQVGRTMGTKTIAECAETNAIVNQLEELGVDYAQGYALGHPMPIKLHYSF